MTIMKMLTCSKCGWHGEVELASIAAIHSIFSLPGLFASSDEREEPCQTEGCLVCTAFGYLDEADAKQEYSCAVEVSEIWWGAVRAAPGRPTPGWR